MSTKRKRKAQTATAHSGSVQRVVRRYVVTETYDRKQSPRTQSKRRPIEEWEEEVLEVFSIGQPEIRAAMLKAAGEVAIENLCAFIAKELPDSDVDGCRRELLEKLAERVGRVAVTPNTGTQRRGE